MAYSSPRLDLISFCVYWGEVREKFIIYTLQCNCLRHEYYHEIHELLLAFSSPSMEFLIMLRTGFSTFFFPVGHYVS